MSGPIELPPAPRNPLDPSPLRRANSLRRTMSIDMTWPDGRGTDLQLLGHGRDLLTPAEGPALVLREDGMRVKVGSGRSILAIEAAPPRPAIAGLLGARGGGHLRKIIDDVLPAERAAGSPLYLMLDDISGTSLIAGWAWSRWPEGESRQAAGGQATAPSRQMESVCAGFRPGSSALRADGGPSESLSATPVGPLPHPEDPQGWHPLADHAGVSMRRARRIDIWLDEGAIHVDASFQDSASAPGGGRVAVHEYRLTALADPVTGMLLEVAADPRILPYPECPAAAVNVGRMVGSPLDQLRRRVLADLRKSAGCTHLNDALRALAEVPVLLDLLVFHQSAPAQD